MIDPVVVVSSHLIRDRRDAQLALGMAAISDEMLERLIEGGAFVSAWKHVRKRCSEKSVKHALCNAIRAYSFNYDKLLLP